MDYRDEQIVNFIISLQQLKNVGNKTINKVILENADKILQELKFDRCFLDELGNKTISKSIELSELSWKDIKRNSSQILERSYNNNVEVIHPFSKKYPKRLLVTNSFPPVLYCLGNTELLNSSKSVAIIGTREPTDFGYRIGKRLSSVLSKSGYVIVSGLAKGCDSAAHVGALEENGATIAVLATPILAPIYPRENQKLADDIMTSNGLLISEYAPNKILKGRELISNLVARDEWQAGLSDGVIVIETSISGGSKHAISHARKSGKPIAAMDYSSRGNVDFKNDQRFSGNWQLIQSGEALPLYFEETIKEFCEIMSSFRKRSLIEDLEISSEDNNTDSEQTTLF